MTVTVAPPGVTMTVLLPSRTLTAVPVRGPIGPQGESGIEVVPVGTLIPEDTPDGTVWAEYLP